MSAQGSLYVQPSQPALSTVISRVCSVLSLVPGRRVITHDQHCFGTSHWISVPVRGRIRHVVLTHPPPTRLQIGALLLIPQSPSHFTVSRNCSLRQPSQQDHRICGTGGHRHACQITLSPSWLVDILVRNSTSTEKRVRRIQSNEWLDDTPHKAHLHLPGLLWMRCIR